MPSLNEQRRLAELLEVWGRGIGATEQLLTNRRALKSALAEKLLLQPMAESRECGQVSPRDSIWQRKTLGEVARVTSGGTPDRAEPSYWGGEIPWVTTGEIQFNTIRSTAERITESGLRQSSAKLLQRQGKTRGQVAKLGIHAATNQACAAVLLLDGYDPDFYFHYLSAQYEAVRALGNAGTQQNLNAGILKAFRCRFLRRLNSN
jgi:restriction endonuclease S subunit